MLLWQYVAWRHQTPHSNLILSSSDRSSACERRPLPSPAFAGAFAVEIGDLLGEGGSGERGEQEKEFQ
jgi:hypothetical protein